MLGYLLPMVIGGCHYWFVHSFPKECFQKRPGVRKKMEKALRSIGSADH
jgi:hypothetical protein